MTPQRIVLASSNPGKCREISHALNHQSIEWVTLSELKITSPEEHASTFIENALIKARHASLQSGLPTLADDSGLIVDALDGEPGVLSARYAGQNASDQDNIRHLLARLEHTHTASNRQAYYCAVVVFLSHPKDPIPLIFHGIWHGSLLSTPQGDAGFGYDPIFYVPTHHCSAAQLPIDIKNSISHRGQTLQQLAYAWDTIEKKLYTTRQLKTN